MNYSAWNFESGGEGGAPYEPEHVICILITYFYGIEIKDAQQRQ
jgi:hypothetical protein